MDREYSIRVGWINTVLTSTIPVIAKSEDEAIAIAFGISGNFYYDQGGSGEMPCPVTASIVKNSMQEMTDEEFNDHCNFCSLDLPIDYDMFDEWDNPDEWYSPFDNDEEYHLSFE